MLHMLFRLDNKVPDHLHRFSIDKRSVMLHHHRLHEELMEDSPGLLPALIILKQQHMIVVRYDGVSYVGRWAIVVDAGFLID